MISTMQSKTFKGNDINAILKDYTQWLWMMGRYIEVVDVVFNENMARYDAYEITIVYNK